MIPPLARPATVEGLFVWIMHRFADAFEEHAILKGGIALQLFDCPRSTTDIDYVFVPFRSKKDVQTRIESVLSELEGATITVSAHSKVLRVVITVDDATVKIEANADLDCATMAMPTARLALAQGQPSRMVRVMALDCALAHKIAAWNERRLLRDLYDCYYLSVRLGVTPDLAVLDRRLGRVESRLPKMTKRRSMVRVDLAAELRTAAEALTEVALQQELAPILPPEELTGLLPRLRSAAVRIAERLEAPRGGAGP